MAVVVIIPARYGSTRFPAKLLQELEGKSLLQHVYERVVQSDVSKVVVATDHEKIVDLVQGFNGDVIMTSVDHRSGTERLAEAVDILNLAEDDVVVNVQGDEPLLPPSHINQVASNLLKYPRFKMATLCSKFDDVDDLKNPNKVKVIFDDDGSARYFSRAVIPWCRDEFAEGIQTIPHGVDYFLHIGIYAYRAGFIKRYVNWPVSPWEQIEKLEQLRVLWHGESIHVSVVKESVGPGVDTKEDLERVRRLLRFA